MDEKTDSKDDDDQARERQAAELQAQIDEIVSGKADTEAKTLRDLTRVDRNLIPTPPEGSDQSVDNKSEIEKGDC
jgi:hypothetical protein